MNGGRDIAVTGAMAAIFGTIGKTARSRFMTKDGSAIHAKRTYTDAAGATHCGTLEWKGAMVTPEENSIVPAGCVKYYEGPAISVLIRRFIPGMKTDYHTDPTHQHQIAFMMAGEAAVGCKDGSSFLLKAGEFASVEDDHGEGHTAIDATGAGFTQLFVAVPA